MSVSTNVPDLTFSNAGVTLPTESEILAGVLADFNNAFGGRLNTNLETPQGQLASSLTAIIGDKNAAIAWLIGQLDADTADGAFQDIIGKLYYLSRNVGESRSQFELRRRQSVAVNAHGSVGAIYGAVASVVGVTDVLVTENYTSNTIPTGATAYPMPPHSVMVSVIGGDDNAIANAIFTKKDLGCDMAGNTGVLVTDPTTGQQYAMRFNRPTPVNVYINVTIARNTALPSDIVARVQNAVMSAFNGTDGGIKASVGSTIFASRFYGGISAISPSVAIAKITLSNGGSYNDSLPIGIDQVPVIKAENINVTIV